MQKEQYQKEINQMLTLFLQNFQTDLLFQSEGELKLKKKTIPSDSKLKELEWNQTEVNNNLIIEGEDYRLKLLGFVEKEKKIWEEKKRKKGIF